MCELAYFVGYGNVWRFPVLAFKHGGAAFLIPYTIALFVISFPTFIAEISYGQLIKCKFHQRFTIINEKLWTVGVGQFLTKTVMSTYYNTLLVWNLKYLYDSFMVPLPWKVDGESEEEIKKNIWNREYFL